MPKLKHKHWRAFQVKDGRKAAPVLVFLIAKCKKDYWHTAHISATTLPQSTWR